MAATVIDGKEIAAQVRAEVAREVAELVESGGGRPDLATVLVGYEPASAIYVEGKQNACGDVVIEAFDHRLPASVGQEEVAGLL